MKRTANNPTKPNHFRTLHISMRCTAPHLKSLLIDDEDWIMAAKQTSHFTNRHSTISKCWIHPDRETWSNIPPKFSKICESLSNWTRANGNGWNRREAIVILVIGIGWKLLTIDYVLLLLVVSPLRCCGYWQKNTNLRETALYKSFKMNTVCLKFGRSAVLLLLYGCRFIVRVCVHSFILSKPYFNDRANVYIR